MKITYLNEKKEYLIDFTNEIFLDDSIEMLKKKICISLEKRNGKLYSINELYLFIKSKSTMNTLRLYNLLSNYSNEIITRKKISGYLQNVSNIGELREKEIYEYYDILQLGIENAFIKDPISIVTKQIQFVVNPFELESFEQDIQIDTQLSKILLDIEKITDGEIYCIVCDDLLNFYSENEEHQNYIIKTYYPFLYKDNIKSKKDLDSLARSSYNTEEFNMQYNVLKMLNKHDKIDGLSEGIKNIEFKIVQNHKVNIPLESLFNYLHSSEKYPYIQLNSGNKIEKVIKLYSKYKSETAEKIPYLGKKKILELKQLTLVGNRLVININESIFKNIFCELDFNGNIHIRLYESSEKITINMLDSHVVVAINPILKVIQNYLEPYGFKINLYNGINDTSIEILNIEFEMDKKISEVKPIDDLMPCLSYVFNSIKSDENEVKFYLIYKRISNFYSFNPMEALIYEYMNKTNDVNELTEYLMVNFPEYKDKEEANKKVVSILQDLEFKGNMNENMKIRRIKHPGYHCVGYYDKMSRNLKIVVTKINNIGYVNILSKYLKFIYEYMVNNLDTESENVIKDCSKIRKDNKSVKEIKQIKEDPPDVVLIDPEENRLDPHIVDHDEEDDYDFDDFDKDDSSDDKGGDVLSRKAGNDFSGVSLRYPSPFNKKMEKLDADLFPKSKSENFNSYSTSCQSQYKRQPVILTEEEFENIKKNHPDSYHGALKYGTKKNKQHYFICPRYWCFLTETSLSREEVEAGKCGGLDAVIPSDAKTIPEGKYIYEFASERFHFDKNNNYINFTPGFLPKNKHEKGYCMPCCFKMKDNDKMQQKRKEECLEGLKDEEKTDDVRDYVIGETRYKRLETNQFGYLPIQLQYFLNFDTTSCYNNNKDKSLKYDNSCLLRLGVEYNAKQSFMSAITKIYNIVSNQSLSLNKMKNHIVQMVTLDLFMTLHNGNLVHIFNNSSKPYKNAFKILRKLNKTIKIVHDKDEKTSSSIKEDKSYKEYTSSDFYKNIGYYNPDFFKFVVDSYENFMEYINNNDTYLDFTYLWDVICIPNENLFKDGINLIIIEFSNNDSTNNVEVVCPTSHYSKHIYDSMTKSIILLKNYDFFEPVIIHRKLSSSDKIVINPIFDNSKDVPKEILSVVKNIKKNLFDKCDPLSMPSLPNKHKYVENCVLETLLRQLRNLTYEIIYYVVNYDFKCVGIKIHVKDANLKGFIPCFPSGIMFNNKTTKFVDDLEIWSPYDETINFLKYIKKYNKFIKCGPLLKIEESGFIVGIITETKQFVQINPPGDPNIEDELKKVVSHNLNNVDKNIVESKNDVSINPLLKYIKFENDFTSIFRMICRKELTNVRNIERRNKITEILLTKKSDSEKKQQIKQILKDLLGKHVSFINYSNDRVQKLDKIELCNMNRMQIYCHKNKLLIPEKNLVDGGVNEEIYYNRLSDELVRHKYLKDFLLLNNSRLYMPDEPLHIHADEIIIVETELNSVYLDKFLTIKPGNPLISITHDTDIPIKTHFYSNEIAINEEIDDSISDKCYKLKALGNNKLNEEFPKNTHERIYKGTVKCVYSLINFVRTSVKLDKKNDKEILKDLMLKYNELYVKFSNKFVNALLHQGKRQYIKDSQKKFSIDNLPDSFLISNLDLWILFNMYQIPLILLSNTKSGLNENKGSMLPVYYGSGYEYIFILCSSSNVDVQSVYHLIIEPDNKKTLFDLMNIKEKKLVDESLLDKFNEVKASHVIHEKKGKLKVKKKYDGPLDIEKYIESFSGD